MKVICDISVTSAPWRPASWSPAALFSGGAQGAWYDPTRIRTLWQDTQATIPAVVDQPVARMNDLSGNSNHAVQAVSSARPTLRQSGDNRLFLEFDGVDDILLAPFEHAVSTACIAQAYNALAAGENWSVSFGIGAQSNGRFYFQANAGATRAIWEPQSGTSLSALGLDAQTRQVAVAQVGTDASAFFFRCNRDEIFWNGDGAAPLDLTGQSINIGARLPGSQHMPMAFFGGVALAAATDEENLNALTGFLAKNSGVNLP